MRAVQALIIGAGPSGLSLAYQLQGDTLVLEGEASVGGLCRSIHQDGGVFDIGGHSFHTPHPEVYELVQRLLMGQWFEQQRQAFVYTHGALIPYPFQKFFDRIPDRRVVQECEAGLKQVTGNPEQAADFEEYILRKFGEGIANHFMLPYNRKLWARDIKKISCEWTVERVAGPRGEKESFDSHGGQRKPLQPDTIVGYPIKGGYEEIYKSFAPHLPGLELNKDVVHIDPQAHIATASDGSQYHWDFLVSTMPLPELARVVEGTPIEIQGLADQLEYMSLRVELLLTGKPLDTLVQRIYCADPEILAHKIAFNHNSSNFLRAQLHHAIMAEVSFSPEKPVIEGDIASNTIAFLCQAGLLGSPSDIIWTGYVNVKYAYPVYTHRRPEQVGGIKDWLAQRHIYTLGRFGDWEYINSDRCIMKGLALGQALRLRYPV